MIQSQAPEKEMVRTAGASDETRVIDTITLAFSGDPSIRWLFPEPHHFLADFPEFVRAFGGNAFSHTTARFTENFSGAALWLPPDVYPDADRLVSLIQRTLAREKLETAFSIMEQMNDFHPKEPHWYLPLIGVDPAWQRRGIGSVLMRQGLLACDRDNLPAYLESTNPENIPLYRRHGFEEIGIIQAGAAPPIIPMRRNPRSTLSDRKDT
jgi:ribosomal protein S18 acetylase RimI-like enzyme